MQMRLIECYFKQYKINEFLFKVSIFYLFSSFFYLLWQKSKDFISKTFELCATVQWNDKVISINIFLTFCFFIVISLIYFNTRINTL